MVGQLPTEPCAQSGNRTRKRSGLSRAALPSWRTWAKVVPDGIEPSFPGCGPSVVAIGPRDRVSQVESPGVAPGSSACGADIFLLDHDPEAEAVGLELTSSMSAAACFPSRFLTNSDDFHNQSLQGGSRETRTHKRLLAVTCFQDRLLIRPDGFLVKLRGLDLNQHDDVQSVSSYRWMTPHRSARRDAARPRQVRGGGVEPPSPGSKPGGLPLADPRSRSRAPCGNRTRLFSLEG